MNQFCHLATVIRAVSADQKRCVKLYHGGLAKSTVKLILGIEGATGTDPMLTILMKKWIFQNVLFAREALTESANIFTVHVITIETQKKNDFDRSFAKRKHYFEQCSVPMCNVLDATTKKQTSASHRTVFSTRVSFILSTFF
jgi:hypothetical protein